MGKTDTQTPIQDKTIMGYMGKFGYFGIEVTPTHSTYSFKKGCAEMNTLLLNNCKSKESQVYFVHICNTNDNLRPRIYQIKDTTVKIMGDEGRTNNTQLSIFNRNDNKRKKTLRFLEEVFA